MELNLERFIEELENRNAYLVFLTDFEKSVTEREDKRVLDFCFRSISEMLDNLLKKNFISDDLSNQDMFETEGVIAEFQNKVRLAYAMGLISKTDYRLLNLLDKVNRVFRRMEPVMSFATEDIKELCQTIQLPEGAFLPPKLWGDPSQLKLKKAELTPDLTKMTERERYIALFIFLYTEIENRIALHGGKLNGQNTEFVSLEQVISHQRRKFLTCMEMASMVASGMEQETNKTREQLASMDSKENQRTVDNPEYEELLLKKIFAGKFKEENEKRLAHLERIYSKHHEANRFRLAMLQTANK